MRLENCDLNIDLVVSAPVMWKQPEPEWVAARNSGVLPLAIFALYSRANYLSFGGAPPFLSDDKRFLFSYFSMLLRSVKQSLTDADEELKLFIEAQGQVYDPGKRFRGEPWDPKADERARRHFRLLLLSLQGTLDAVADLIALFLTGLVPGLRLGRAQFLRIELWLHKPLPAQGLVIIPQLQYLEDLYSRLRPLVIADAPESDWLPLMRMFRNKAAHLGDSVFRYVGLNDNTGKVYTFVPRRWPYIWEEHMHPAGTAGTAQSIPNLLRESLVHDDIISYTRGVRKRVTELVGAAAEIIDSAYIAFKDFQTNKAALAELKKSSEAFEFRYFLT